MEQIQKQKTSLLGNIATLKSNKNPFGVFFVLADLKDIFINLWETLLNSIELNYSKNARSQYKNITQKYRDAGIFEALYNHYFHTNDLKKFKHEIDDYFEHSFFIDISFFFFTLSRNKKYQILFEIIWEFHQNESVKSRYFTLATYLEKKEYLSKIHKNFSSISNDKTSFYIIKFLNHFKKFDFSEISISHKNSTPNYIKLIKKISLYILEHKEKYHLLYNFILETFVLDKNIYNEIIEHFEEEKLFEVILFLKNDIHSGIDNAFILNYESKDNIKNYLKISKNIDNMDLEKKISFLLEKEKDFFLLWREKWNFARLSLKRQFLEENYWDIVDLILGITDIPSEVFYLLKQQNLDINLENISLYNEIKELILYIDKSYFLSFVRPFLLRKISNYFNYSDQKYYVIKFILCVVLSNSYSEYKRLSSFFYNLESFYRKWWEAYLSRIFQFWWIILFIGIVGFFLPFGFLIAMCLLWIKKIVVFFLWRISPKLRMSLNFQFTTYATTFAILSIFLGFTIWHKDNVALTYNSLKPIVNSVILPAHESLKIITSQFEWLKANIFENKNKRYEKIYPWFSDIDYLKGKNLYDLKK